MRQLFLIFSHKLTNSQIEDAKKNLGIDKFIYLPENLQKLWSNIPPDLKNLDNYLEPIKEFLKQNAKDGDYVLIQGDFGGVYNLVNFAKEINLIPIHSTTRRDVEEKIVNGKVEKLSRFEHVMFRRY